MVDDEKIIGFLKRHPKQLFSAKEIAEILGEEGQIIIKSFQGKIKKLVKYNLIKADKINRMLASKLYGQNYKRGLTLYYYEPEL